MVGAFGFRGVIIFASCGVWFPFLLLQERQAATTFSHRVAPLRDRGTTWSMVSKGLAGLSPQY